MGWNLLLVPAAFRLYHHLRRTRDQLLAVATSAGILSAVLWALGGVTRIPRALETAYLVLAACWLAVVGARAVDARRLFGAFTLIVAAFTTLDAVFNLFEPVPFAIYLLAAPKLPLAAVWSIAAGLFLLRHAGASGHASLPSSAAGR